MSAALGPPPRLSASAVAGRTPQVLSHLWTGRRTLNRCTPCLFVWHCFQLHMTDCLSTWWLTYAHANVVLELPQVVRFNLLDVLIGDAPRTLQIQRSPKPSMAQAANVPCTKGFRLNRTLRLHLLKDQAPDAWNLRTSSPRGQP